MSVDIVPEHAAVNRSVTGSSPVWGANENLVNISVCKVFSLFYLFKIQAKLTGLLTNAGKTNRSTVNRKKRAYEVKRQ